ncbi:hypothetical protein BFC17_19955 [Alteromonas lipolytica]|uniref:Uncharacterized protein n=2 Tax=Alteromonas lipolytica TaxID=1856405 RepID=A0A1E8FD34_9ALTE|nr:hypothetical protein BFC17_19955 [Alteromonas lipolytica]
MVVLGTLSVTAAPVFLDVASEANIAKTINTMTAFQRGLHLLHIKKVVSGKDTVTIDTVDIQFTDEGWPVGSAKNSAGCAELWNAAMEGSEDINVVNNFSSKLQPGWNTYSHLDVCAYINSQGDVAVAENEAPHFVYFIEDTTFKGRKLNYDGKAGDVILYEVD